MIFSTPAETASVQTDAMTELEELLRSPSGEDVRKGILERLRVLEKFIAEEARDGLPPAAFERNDAIGQAILAARAVIVAYPVTSRR